MTRPIRCILLVDDDPDDNFLHRLVIDESGLCDQVRVAETGPDALRYLTETDQPGYLRPDALLLDINMPGMNGFEFLEQYHRLPDALKSQVVVVMLTTSPDPGDLHRAGQLAEINAYQPKPLTKAMLQNLVDQYFS